MSCRMNLPKRVGIGSGRVFALTAAGIARRRFLGGLLAAGAACSARPYAPKIAAQLYVWTQSLRARKMTLAEGLDEVLDGVKEAGFRRLELMSAFLEPELRERTLAGLKARKLELSVLYHGGAMHEEAAAAQTIRQALQAADAMRAAGTRYLNTNPAPKPGRVRKTDAELDLQARMVRRLDKELKQRGVTLMLHHHDSEMRDQAREWRHLLRNTETPVCIDAHWVWRGGQDVITILGEAGDRTVSLHLRNSRSGVWSEELGDGDIDYRAVAAHLQRTGFDGFLVVELAREKGTPATRPLTASLRLSREYVESVFGARA